MSTRPLPHAAEAAARDAQDRDILRRRILAPGQPSPLATLAARWEVSKQAVALREKRLRAALEGCGLTMTPPPAEGRPPAPAETLPRDDAGRVLARAAVEPDVLAEIEAHRKTSGNASRVWLLGQLVAAGWRARKEKEQGERKST